MFLIFTHQWTMKDDLGKINWSTITGLILFTYKPFENLSQACLVIARFKFAQVKLKPTWLDTVSWVYRQQVVFLSLGTAEVTSWVLTPGSLVWHTSQFTVVCKTKTSWTQKQKTFNDPIESSASRLYTFNSQYNAVKPQPCVQLRLLDFNFIIMLLCGSGRLAKR